MSDDIYYANYSNLLVPFGFPQLEEFLKDHGVLKKWPTQKVQSKFLSRDLEDDTNNVEIPKGLQQDGFRIFQTKFKKQINKLEKIYRRIDAPSKKSEGKWIDDLFIIQSYLDSCLVEATGEVAYHPSLYVNDWYFDLIVPSECEKHDTLIYKIYNALKEQEANIHNMIGKFTNFQSISIPPIIAIILSRCTKRKDIWLATMELRDELQPLRNRLNELISDLKDPDISLAKKIKTYTKIKKSLVELSKRYSSFDFLDSRDLNIGIDSHKILKVDQVNSAFSAETDYNAIKDMLFKIGAKQLKKWFYRRTLKEFFRIQSKLDKITEHSQLIKKVWGYELTNQDFGILSG
jgi:hypothetical protein